MFAAYQYYKGNILETHNDFWICLWSNHSGSIRFLGLDGICVIPAMDIRVVVSSPCRVVGVCGYWVDNHYEVGEEVVNARSFYRS